MPKLLAFFVMNRPNQTTLLKGVYSVSYDHSLQLSDVGKLQRISREGDKL